MNLCHIEVVTSEINVPLSELELSRVLEPDNPKDCYSTQWLYITVIQKMGYITKPFRSLVFYSRVIRVLTELSHWSMVLEVDCY